MDDLEFRRQVYADPNSKDASLLEAAKADPSKAQFWNEMKHMDNNVSQALDIPVPDDLANKLILRQSIESHNQQRKKGRLHIALAASIAFVAGLSFMALTSGPSSLNTSDIALAHMHYDSHYAYTTKSDVSLDEVKSKLASFGADLTAPFNAVYFANYCFFDGQRSLHLVLGNGAEKFTVFITPKEEGEIFQANFEDDTYIGRGWQTEDMNVLVLTERNQAIEPAFDEVQSKMYFSI